MAKTEVLEYVKGIGEVHRSYDPFDKQLADLREDGIKSPVSVRDAAYIRVHGHNTNYTRTCHAPVCAKDSPVIVARMSLLVKNMEMAEQAVQAHRNSQYPVVDDDFRIYAQWEKIAKQDAVKAPEKRRAIILPQRGNYRINRDSDEARFFFQDTIHTPNSDNDYFVKFVKGDSIPVLQIPVSAVDSANGTIVNYVGFDGPEVESNLYFRGRNLDVDYRALGVRKSAEGTSQKNSAVLLYTQRELTQTLSILEEIRQGKVRISDLKGKVAKVAQFLQRLKQ